jgi:hypothetical protein
MEENMSSPMRTSKGFVDQIFVKWLAKGISGKQGGFWGSKEMRWWRGYLRQAKEGLGGSFYVGFEGWWKRS